MTIKEITEKLESNDFICRVNFASGFELFLLFVQQEPAFEELLKILGDRISRLEILSRIIELSKMEPSLGKEHRWDTSLAVYTFALSESDFEAGRAAAAICQNTKSVRWAKRLAAYILREKMRSYSGQFDFIVQPHDSNFSNPFKTGSDADEVDAVVMVA